jgi:hypothetical protein
MQEYSFNMLHCSIPKNRANATTAFARRQLRLFFLATTRLAGRAAQRRQATPPHCCGSCCSARRQQLGRAATQAPGASGSSDSGPGRAVRRGSSSDSGPRASGAARRGSSSLTRTGATGARRGQGQYQLDEGQPGPARMGTLATRGRRAIEQCCGEEDIGWLTDIRDPQTKDNGVKIIRHPIASHPSNRKKWNAPSSDQTSNLYKGTVPSLKSGM